MGNEMREISRKYSIIEETLPPKGTRRGQIGQIDAESLLRDFLKQNIKNARVEVDDVKPRSFVSLLRSYVYKLKLPVKVHQRGKIIHLERRD